MAFRSSIRFVVVLIKSTPSRFLQLRVLEWRCGVSKLLYLVVMVFPDDLSSRDLRVDKARQKIWAREQLVRLALTSFAFGSCQSGLHHSVAGCFAFHESFELYVVRLRVSYKHTAVTSSEIPKAISRNTSIPLNVTPSYVLLPRTSVTRNIGVS